MAISNMLRRALNLIPSSVTSTAEYGFTRVRSFTGSFNDRTSLLLAAAPAAEPVQEVELEPTPPPAQSQVAPAPATTGTAPFDIEAATAETLAGAGGSGADGGQGEEPSPTALDAEVKRTAKTVQTVCLFAASASLVLFANLPSRPGSTGAAVAAEHAAGAALYSVDMAFICLGLFTSLGLSMFSIVKSGTDPAVASVQKRAMVMAVTFVLVSFTLRMCMMLPSASLESVLLVLVLLAGALAVYLALTWRFGGGRSAAEIAAGVSGGSAGAGAADRV